MTIYNVKTAVVSLVEAPDPETAAAAHIAHLLAAGFTPYKGEPIGVMESEPLPAGLLPDVLAAPLPADPPACAPVHPAPATEGRRRP